MTMTDWITQTFATNDQGAIVLEQLPSGGLITITPARLATLLAPVAAPPSHADLSALPLAIQGGWQKYFDAWEIQGYLTRFDPATRTLNTGRVEA